MEMSEAAGLRRLTSGVGDPLRASTFGVGEILFDATRHGARKVIIGLGGSATNDGGFGMARALGFGFFAGDKELTKRVSDLQALARIARPQNVVGAFVSNAHPKERRLAPAPLEHELPKIIAAVDVRN